MIKPDNLLIDGTGILFRTFFSIPPMYSRDNVPINALFGSLRMIKKLMRDEPTTSVGLVFDSEKPSFRVEQYPEYKAQRPPCPHDLKTQLPLAIALFKKAGLPVYHWNGLEADDIIGSLAFMADRSGKSTTIITSDNDLLQLVSETTTVKLLKNSGKPLEVYTPKRFTDEYCFPVESFVDYKALVGDSSDNLPGVKSIGPKTACTLLSQYKNLEGIYENIDEIKPRFQTVLSEQKEQAFRIRELATIKCDADVHPVPELSDCLFCDEEYIRVIRKLGIRDEY